MPQQNLAPTLLIGLGGTGKDVLLRIRRLFYERVGRDNMGTLGYPIIGYLLLDTDEQKLDDLAGEPLPPFVGRNIRFTRGENVPEAIICGINPNEFNEYFAGGYQTFPHIFRWMPPSMSRLTSIALSNGAGQNRLFGRLAFFRHYKAIRQAIEGKLEQLIKNAADPTHRQRWLPQGMEVDLNRIEVMIVYSLAGGTGAGMFLDVGMLARDIISKRFQGTPYITHYAVLPEALTSAGGPLISSEQKDKVRENAYAALLEMEYFAQRKEGLFDLSIPAKPKANEFEGGLEPIYEVEWERDNPISIYEPPWNACYLIGSSNDPLIGSPQPYHVVYQMIAEHIFLDFDLSDFGREKRSARSNLEDQLQLLYKQEIYDEEARPLFPRFNSRRFSAFGMAQLRFDRDRMRRAAGHRLARLLLKYWGRESDIRPSVVDQYAREDLGIPADRKLATQFTPTLLREEQGTDKKIVRLALEAIYQRLAQRGVSGEDTWGNMLRAEHQELRRQIESGEFSGDDQLLLGWKNKHLNRLTPAGPGDLDRAGVGEALRTSSQNRDVLLSEINERLDRLFRYRINLLGLRDSFKVFQQYYAVLNEQIGFAEGEQNRASGGHGEWLERLREARTLPLGYSRAAVRIESLRAVDAVLREIGGQYIKALAGDIRKCLGLAQQRFANDPKLEGSYSGAVMRFFDGIKLIRDYLEARFAELSDKDGGQRTARLSPEMNSKKIGRVTALIDQQSEETYDAMIAAALGHQNMSQIDWGTVESEVFKELSNSGDRRLGGVNSLPDLLLRYSPIAVSGNAPSNAFEDLARELATACEAMLKNKFAGNTTALEEYHRQPDQEKLLDNLRTYSAPYLRRNQAVNVDDANVNTKQLLGLARYDTTDAQRFISDLRRSGDRDPLTLAGMQSLSMNDDAIILYREKAGIPLCYYAELDEMGKLYDRSTRIREAHFDYVYLQGRLPEIRVIDRSKQQKLISSLELTLFGLMTERITCEFDRDDKSKRTFKFCPIGGLEYPLGGHLEEVVRRLAEQEKLRNNLSEEVVDWLGGRGVDQKGLLLAVLWAALRTFQDELRDRIQGIIDRNPGKAARQDEHPLLKIIRDRMLRKVRQRLESIPGGIEHIAPLLEWEKVANNRDLTRTEKQQAIEKWRDYVKGTFRLINQDDLPIPVIVQPSPGFNIARSKDEDSRP